MGELLPTLFRIARVRAANYWKAVLVVPSPTGRKLLERVTRIVSSRVRLEAGRDPATGGGEVWGLATAPHEVSKSGMNSSEGDFSRNPIS